MKTTPPLVSDSPARNGRQEKIWRWLLLVGVALALVGAKWQLIARCGSDIPFGDQWGGEAAALYMPYVQNQLGPAQLLRAHNEHRIVFTRLLDLALLKLNGQWDPLLQMTVQALLIAAFGVVLVSLSTHRLPPLAASLVGAAAVALLGSVALWENTLSGFQSQFYFLLLFSVLHVWLSTARPVFSRAWWIGQAAGVGALFSMAPAFLGPVAVLGWLAWRCLRVRATTPKAGVTVAWNLVLGLAGWCMLGPQVMEHTDRPTDASGLAHAFLHIISWPVAQWELGLLVWLPLLAFVAWQCTRPDREASQGPVLALALFVGLLSASLAYARGGIASRYAEIFSLGLIANLLCLLRLPARGRGLILKTALGTLWVAWLGLALVRHEQLDESITLQHERTRQERSAAALRECLATGSLDLMRTSGEFMEGDIQVIAVVFAEPRLRAILPLSLRAPLPLQADQSGDPAPAFALALPNRPTQAAGWSPSDQGGPNREFRSKPLSASQPLLAMYVCGVLSPPEAALELLTVEGKTYAPMHERLTSTARWQRVNFPNPGRVFRVVAREPKSGAWLAFTDPFELGRWSWLSTKALGFAQLLCRTGWVLLAIVFARSVYTWLKEDAPKTERLAEIQP